MSEFSRPVLARVDGWGINTPNLDVAIRSIIASAIAGRPLSVFTLNLDHLVKLRRSEPFRHAYWNADIVTADGAPVAWLAKRQNTCVERATGADMLVPLVEAAAHDGIPIFLFGATPETLELSEQRLGDLTGGTIKIVGRMAPSATFDPEGPEADRALAAIENSKARLCLIALGAPKQELFANRARSRGIGCAMICNGASLDFLIGAQTRAPKWLRTLGLEWTWRLATSPRRLAKRYFDCAVVFFDIVVCSALRRPGL